MRVGLDIGSTTIKCVVLNDAGEIVFSTYERHFSHILEKGRALLEKVAAEYLPDGKAYLAISGSAGMGLADSCKVPFVQEVFATRVAANRLVPGTDCIIELGGEDAKILFLTNGTEVRMNGSCAGGTGAFIDQMATLLKMGADEMDRAAQQATRTYTIASRCGVFAKSDIQPLINQGAQKPVTSQRQHLSGSGQPDHRGPGPGPPHPGQHPVPGRAADLLQNAAPEL